MNISAKLEIVKSSYQILHYYMFYVRDPHLGRSVVANIVPGLIDSHHFIRLAATSS